MNSPLEKTSAGTRHIAQFVSLRGLAALWVFVSHALLISEQKIFILSSGGWAVDVFVMLSGFVIGLLVMQRAEPYPIYIFRRFVRLYPLYILALILGFATSAYYATVVGTSYFGAVVDDNFFMRNQLIDAHLWEHLAAHLTMLHGAIPDGVLPLSALAFSGPLWSISLEWQFYLVAPLLIWLLDYKQPGRLPWVFATLIAVLLLHWYCKQVWVADVPAFLPLRLPLFALGILSAHFWHKAHTIAPGRLLVCAAIIGIAILASRRWDYVIPLGTWLGVYTAAILNGRFRPASLFNALLSSAPLTWLGERSYGLYVLHMPIMLTIAHFIIMPRAQELGQTGTFIALGSCLAVIIFVAAICHRLIEKPAIKWASQIARRSQRRPDTTHLAHPKTT